MILTPYCEKATFLEKCVHQIPLIYQNLDVGDKNLKADHELIDIVVRYSQVK